MKRTSLIGALLLAGSTFFTAAGSASAWAASRAAASGHTLAWLNTVTRVENTLVGLGTDLALAGTTTNASKSATIIKRAQGRIAKAMKVRRAGGRVPKQFKSLNRLLTRSLDEYAAGLQSIKFGLLRHKSFLVSNGLKIVRRGSADQNKFAAQLRKATNK